MSNCEWAQQTVRESEPVNSGQARFYSFYTEHPSKEGLRRATAVIRRETEEDTYAVAYSVCNPVDQFSRVYGQAVALQRLDTKSCFYLKLYDKVDVGVSYAVFNQESFSKKQPLAVVAGKNFSDVLNQVLGFWLERRTLQVVPFERTLISNRVTTLDHVYSGQLRL